MSVQDGVYDPARGPLRDVAQLQQWRFSPTQFAGWVLCEAAARISGKPWPGQVPLFDFGGFGWWIVSTIALFSWFSALLLAVSDVGSVGMGDLVLVPLIFVMQVVLVGRLRVQQVTFGHHAVHGAISRVRPWLNTFVAEFATIVPLAQNPSDYRADHIQRHHRTKFFTTIHDPDAGFLHMLGFRRGMSKRDLYRRLCLTLVSPRFHFVYLRSRMRSTFLTATPMHRVLAMAWLAALCSLSLVFPWWVFLTAVVVPWGPLYHVSALLQFLTEHKWLMEEAGPANRREYADRCVGRFSLLPTPVGRHGIEAMAAWAGWGVQMLPEVLVRLGSWVGDLPAHDHHHLVGHIGHDPEDWHEAIFERQRSIDEGDPSGLASREVYGLRAALDWVFEGLSERCD